MRASTPKRGKGRGRGGATAAASKRAQKQASAVDLAHDHVAPSDAAAVKPSPSASPPPLSPCVKRQTISPAELDSHSDSASPVATYISIRKTAGGGVGYSWPHGAEPQPNSATIASHDAFNHDGMDDDDGRYEQRSERSNSESDNGEQVFNHHASSSSLFPSPPPTPPPPPIPAVAAVPIPNNAPRSHPTTCCYWKWGYCKYNELCRYQHPPDAFDTEERPRPIVPPLLSSTFHAHTANARARMRTSVHVRSQYAPVVDERDLRIEALEAQVQALKRKVTAKERKKLRAKMRRQQAQTQVHCQATGAPAWNQAFHIAPGAASSAPLLPFPSASAGPALPPTSAPFVMNSSMNGIGNGCTQPIMGAPHPGIKRSASDLYRGGQPVDVAIPPAIITQVKRNQTHNPIQIHAADSCATAIPPPPPRPPPPSEPAPAPFVSTGLAFLLAPTPQSPTSQTALRRSTRRTQVLQ